MITPSPPGIPSPQRGNVPRACAGRRSQGHAHCQPAGLCRHHPGRLRHDHCPGPGRGSRKRPPGAGPGHHDPNDLRWRHGRLADHLDRGRGRSGRGRSGCPAGPSAVRKGPIPGMTPRRAGTEDQQKGGEHLSADRPSHGRGALGQSPALVNPSRDAPAAQLKIQLCVGAIAINRRRGPHLGGYLKSVWDKPW